MLPLVSIVLPVFNAQNFIKQSMLSIVSQEYDNWELIVVDDCSTDNSFLIAESLSFTDNRITVVKNRLNSGPAISRNYGASLAKGEYLAFIDADDIWLPNKLTVQIPVMLHDGCDLSYTGSFNKYLSLKPIKLTRRSSAHIRSNFDFLTYNKIALSTVVLKKSIFDSYKFINCRHEDFELWLRLYFNGFKFKYIDNPLMIYSIHPSSLNSSKIRSLSWVWLLYRNHMHFGIFVSSIMLLLYIVRASLRL
jgi:glycosyltransferase involved in cell wall biosynthesis